MKLDLVGNRKKLYMVSGALFVLSLILLAIPPALRPGIEFTAGTTTQLRFQKAVSEQDLRDAYAALGHPEARVQAVSAVDYLIRTSELQVPPGSFTTPGAEDTVKPVGPQPPNVTRTATLGAAGATGKIALRATMSDTDVCTFGATNGELAAGTKVDIFQVSSCPDNTRVYRVGSGATGGWVAEKDLSNIVSTTAAGGADQGERTTIENALRERFGEFTVLEFASVSPTVSRAAVRNAAIAVAVATIFILGYIAFAFASVPRPWRYGTAAIVAMLHDVVITVGFFSLFGKLFGTEVNLMFVTGLLTVIGFSVHDTIVIFDRIRENIRQAPMASLTDNVNAAILQTIARSLNTSITTTITVTAMVLLGGATIQSFLLVILIGVIAGTYSSIGLAAQLLVSWELGEFDRFMFWRRGDAAASQAG